MITLLARKGKIHCNFNYSQCFQDISDVLRSNSGTFHKPTKTWIIPAHKYHKTIEEMEDFDTIELAYEDELAIKVILSPKPELRLSKVRNLFKQDLLSFPPKEGIAPNQNYQKTDIVRAINQNRYGMFLDMGLGKSYYKSAIIAHLRGMGVADKALVISSNIGAANLAHEIKKFIDVDPSEIAVMTKAGKDRELFKPGVRIAITNYNTFKYISDYYYQVVNKKKPTGKYRKAVIPFEKWLGGKDGILLLDESHLIGNGQSQITHKLMIHKDFFEYRYLFTGTPSDKIEKLYTQLKILDDNLVDNLTYNEWLQEYAYVGNNFSAYAITGWKHDKIEELNARISKHYGVFRDTKDTLILPDNYVKKMFVDITLEHKFIYEAFIKETLSDLFKRTGKLLTRDVVNTFPYLQQALDSPKMLEAHEDLLTAPLLKQVKKFKLNNHQKALVTDDILEEHFEKKEKGILWIYHPQSAEDLAERYKKYNPIVITGATKNREELLELFKTSPKHNLLIGSIKVLNTSITLTEATFQIYYERPHNYNEVVQSSKRIYRIGQEKKTITYILIFDNTLDVALDINLRNKDTLNKKILSKEFLTKDEWQNIFQTDSSEFDLQ